MTESNKCENRKRKEIVCKSRHSLREWQFLLMETDDIIRNVENVGILKASQRGRGGGQSVQDGSETVFENTTIS